MRMEWTFFSEASGRHGAMQQLYYYNNKKEELSHKGAAVVDMVTYEWGPQVEVGHGNKESERFSNHAVETFFGSLKGG